MTEIDSTHQNLTQEAALAKLSFCVEAGAPDVFSEKVQNRYQLEVPSREVAPVGADEPRQKPDRSARTAPRGNLLREGPPPAFQSAPQALSLGDTEAIALAQQIAARATSLQDLRDGVAGFTGCALSNTAKNQVFDDGNPNARLMLVGEVPGRDEDLEGKPFAGERGRLLDQMLAAIGLKRNDIYLANMLPWRPPGDRQRTSAEQAICLPFITRQIELCKPDILIFAGGAAAKQMLGVETTLPRLRGQWKTYTDASGRAIPALTIFPPDYLLRHPSHKRLAWRDLLALKARLVALPARPDQA